MKLASSTAASSAANPVCRLLRWNTTSMSMAMSKGMVASAASRVCIGSVSLYTLRPLDRLASVSIWQRRATIKAHPSSPNGPRPYGFAVRRATIRPSPPAHRPRPYGFAVNWCLWGLDNGAFKPCHEICDVVENEQWLFGAEPRCAGGSGPCRAERYSAHVLCCSHV